MCSKLIVTIILLLISGKMLSQEYSVGFDSYFMKDYSRKTDSMDYRPVLFNLWYPAVDDSKKSFINRKDLLRLKSTNATEIKFSTAYYLYALSSLKRYLFDQFESADSAFIDKEFEIYLSLETRAKNKLKPITKKFPLVIYHQGLGGTIDDNLELYEYLASKGFAAVGSTFFRDLKNLSPGSDQYSRQDVNLLINEAAKYDFIDLSYIVFIGHSYGAQAGFTIINQDGCPISLFISLDTTFDYNDEKTVDAVWDYIMPQIKSRSHLVKIPTIHMADFYKDETPFFDIPKRHIYSDRLLITTKNHITHDGFVTLGYYEAKLLKKHDENFDIDTVCYKNVNHLVFNLISNKEVPLSKVAVDTNYFHSEYLPKLDPVESMSFYDAIEQNYGIDSVLNLIRLFNKYDPYTQKEMGWLAGYYLENKNFKKAQQFADIFFESYPGYYYTYFIKCKIFLEQNEIEKAKEYAKLAYNATYKFGEKWEMRHYFTEKGISFKD
jgi:hypothetical protein